MRNSAERKAKAKKFNEKHLGAGQSRQRRWQMISVDDDPAQIPSRGRRGRGAHRPRSSVRDSVVHSADASRYWVETAPHGFLSNSWAEGIGTLPTNPETVLVVIDTNVLTSVVSGQPFQQECSQIVHEVLSGRIRPCVIKPLVAEYRHVLSRPEFPGGLKLLDQFLPHCLPLSGRPQTPAPTVDRHPPDNILLFAQALAFELRAKSPPVVSRDNHLLGLPPAGEHLVMHPKNFLGWLARNYPQSMLGLSSLSDLGDGT